MLNKPLVKEILEACVALGKREGLRPGDGRCCAVPHGGLPAEVMTLAEAFREGPAEYCALWVPQEWSDEGELTFPRSATADE